MGRSDQVDYPIWSKAAKPEIETTAGFDTIKDRFKALKPERLTTAASAYQEASSALAKLTNDLQKHAQTLIDAWEGDAAQKALDQMGQLHWTANELSNGSITTARTMHWYGNDIMQWYKDLGDKMSDGMIHTGGDDDQARRLMNRINLRTATAHNSLPQKITKDLPSDKGNVGDPNGPGGPGGNPGGSPGGPGGHPGGFGGSHLPKSDPFGNNHNSPHLPSDNSHFPGGNNHFPNDHSKFPGGGGGGGSSLAGYHPPGGGGFGGGLGGGAGGLGGDPFGAGNGLGGAAGTGPGGLGSGDFGAGAGAANGMTGAAGRGGITPMPHSGRGQDEKEHKHCTRLTEDEDVWGADGDTTPPLIC